MILASSPPSSIATSVLGANVLSAVDTHTTSCSKGIFITFDKARPPEPVIQPATSMSPISFIAFSRSSLRVSLIFAKCLLYSEYNILLFSSIIAIFTVVEPISIPRCFNSFTSFIIFICKFSKCNYNLNILFNQSYSFNNHKL